MKTNISTKQFQFGIALIAILSIISSLTNFVELNSENQNLSLFLYFCSPINLHFFRETYLSEIDFEVLNKLTFTLLFTGIYLISAILYLLSKKKEKRLLLFVLGIIFINQFGIIIINLLGLITFFIQQGFNKISPLFFVFSFVKPLVLMATTFVMIKFEQQKDTFQFITTSYGDYETKELKNPAFFVRVFHQLLDVLLLVLIFSITLFGLFKPYIEIVGNTMGQKGSLLFIFVILRFVYYPITEFLFGATPAKLLTNTRVCTPIGESPSLSSILMRTLCRSIPFDGISFLGQNGWHDKFSHTTVAYLEPTGVKGRYYWVLPFALITLLLSGVYIEDYLENRKQILALDKIAKKDALQIEKSLSNMRPNTLISFEELDDIGLTSPIYYVVEKVTPTGLSGIILANTIYDNNSTYALEKLYYNQKKDLPKLFLPMEKLKQAYSKNYEPNPKKNALQYVKFEGIYSPIKIVNISPLNGTSIQINNASIYNENEIFFNIFNIGWPGVLKEAKIVSGVAKIDYQSNSELPSATDNGRPEIGFKITQNKIGETYKIEFLFLDSSNKTQKYLLEGEEIHYTLHRITP